MLLSERPAEPPTLVLVHGAWHGAWCWEQVQDELRTLGVPSVSVDLPGHGDRPGPLADLAGDAACVESVVASISGPVVLVGHSYGGAVISAVAGSTEAEVAGLIFVAAYRLKVGESVAERAHSWPEPSALSESIGFADDALVLDPETCIDALYARCDIGIATAAAARLGPQSATALTDPLPAPSASLGDRSLREHYIVCTDDRAVPPSLQRDMAAGCGRVTELDADHSPFLSRPADLAALLAHRD